MTERMQKLLRLSIHKQFHLKQILTMNINRQLSVRVRASELREKRSEVKSKAKSTTIVNCADFQVIGSAWQGYSPSLLVRSEGNLYLFNCNEGTQRLCYSNKIRLVDLENIFITKHSWDRVAGALGLALTVQDIGSLKLCIHSSEGIEDFFKSSSHFTQFFTGMKCLTKSYLDGEYRDSGIHIQPIIHNDSGSSTSTETSNIKVSVTKKLKSNSTLLAYNCYLPDLPGSLNPQKCRELNVPIGRELAILKSGQDLVLADGSIVKSSDVCFPKSIGLNFLVVECSTEKEIDYLFSNVTLSKIRSQRSTCSNNERQVGVVVHLSPSEIVNNSLYRSWIDGFDQSCKHLIIADSNLAQINFIDSYRLQYLLSKLDSEIFPSLALPATFTTKAEEKPVDSKEKEIGQKSSLDNDMSYRKVEFEDLEKITYARSFDKINIRPHKSAEFRIDNADLDQLYAEAIAESNYDKLLKELKNLQKNLPTAQEYEPELVFLGTGSAVPNKFRNTSGILLNLPYPKESSVILDCGEDTHGQLCRFYGTSEKNRILKNLKIIYVSHQHADHHIGLLNLLRERKKLTDDKLILLLPPGIDKLLNYHNENFENLSDTYEVFCTSRLKTIPATGIISTPTSEIIKPELIKLSGGLLSELTVVGVQHCINSCAITMCFHIGHPDMETFTVAYSGDARPNKDFILAAKGCDLLIHEATFDHRAHEDALFKKHSTTTEAIEVGKQMEAKFTILTHFTQKYSKIPYFTTDFDDSVGFAFDFMSLRCPSNFSRLPILKPILTEIFKRNFDRADALYKRNLDHQKLVNSLIKHS